MPVSSRIASRSVTRFHGGREVDLAVVARPRRPRTTTSCSSSSRHVAVVGVGLVPLEHRELGVVLVREALVAEVLADLVDPLEPADDQPLEVELDRDAQVEVAVERVVVGGERPRERAAVERLQHRRLDLEEAALVEPAPDGGDHLRAQDEQLARLLVRDQVELAVAVAGLDVLEPVVLLGRRAQRLGQQLPAARLRVSSPRLVVKAVPSTPIRSPRSRCTSVSNDSSPSTSLRAWTWIRPERSTRSRNAAPPWPRRAARRPATR